MRSLCLLFPVAIEACPMSCSCCITLARPAIQVCSQRQLSNLVSPAATAAAASSAPVNCTCPAFAALRSFAFTSCFCFLFATFFLLFPLSCSMLLCACCFCCLFSLLHAACGVPAACRCNLPGAICFFCNLHACPPSYAACALDLSLCANRCTQSCLPTNHMHLGGMQHFPRLALLYLMCRCLCLGNAPTKRL